MIDYRHSLEIEEILRNAQQEQALEKQYLAIEEEWMEQVHVYMHLYMYNNYTCKDSTYLFISL